MSASILTDQLDVACWFATHRITTSTSGLAKTAFVDLNSDVTPTVFVFRCPKDAVFEYASIKPKDLPTGRPDRQSAWFGHVVNHFLEMRAMEYEGEAKRALAGIYYMNDSGVV